MFHCLLFLFFFCGGTLSANVVGNLGLGSHSIIPRLKPKGSILKVPVNPKWVPSNASIFYPWTWSNLWNRYVWDPNNPHVSYMHKSYFSDHLANQFVQIVIIVIKKPYAGIHLGNNTWWFLHSPCALAQVLIVGFAGQHSRDLTLTSHWQPLLCRREANPPRQSVPGAFFHLVCHSDILEVAPFAV